MTVDFTGPDILMIPDSMGVGDVGLPLNAPPGTVSGWDMVDLRLTYDTATDTLYVGINTFGIAGDADGDEGISYSLPYPGRNAGCSMAIESSTLGWVASFVI